MQSECLLNTLTDVYNDSVDMVVAERERERDVSECCVLCAADALFGPLKGSAVALETKICMLYAVIKRCLGWIRSLKLAIMYHCGDAARKMQQKQKLNVGNYWLMGNEWPGSVL